MYEVNLQRNFFEHRLSQSAQSFQDLENVCTSLRGENKSLHSTVLEAHMNNIDELFQAKTECLDYMTSMIESLASSINQTDQAEVDLLKRQVAERDEQIKQLMV